MKESPKKKMTPGNKVRFGGSPIGITPMKGLTLTGLYVSFAFIVYCFILMNNYFSKKSSFIQSDDDDEEIAVIPYVSSSVMILFLSRMRLYL
jgi:hypothetical protein